MPETRILVVDDEPGIAHLCERLLARAGYAVRAITNPHRALRELDTSPVDLLLVDIRMPGMNGFELMQTARKKHPDLAVVIMTGFGTVETAVEALRVGADGLILKPFSSGAELVESVRHALEAHRNKRDALRLQALRPLFEVSRRLFVETEAPKLTHLLIEAIGEHLHAPLAGVYRFGEETPAERLAALGEMPEPDVVYEALRGVSLPLRVVATPLDENISSLMQQLQCASLLCVQVPTQPDGTLILLAARPEDALPFSEADMELLVVLAHQGAVALENARLYSELRSYLRQVEESQKMLVQAEKMAT
ncbi:MAG: response regulator, partial [Anaerolineae bacterium]